MTNVTNDETNGMAVETNGKDDEITLVPMTEFIVRCEYQEFLGERHYHRCEPIVRCRDCKHLDDSEYKRWDDSLAECYGEPPLFCDLLSINEWRMDGDRRVADTTFLEVEPDGFCSFGERRDDGIN